MHETEDAARPTSAHACGATSDSDDLKYWVGFNLVNGVGPVRFRRLLDVFGTAREAWNASAATLTAAGMDPRCVESILAVRARANLDRHLERIAQRGITLLTWDDEDYPRQLKNIHSPPPLIYVQGKLAPQDEIAVAVVGTRRLTVYGRECTMQLAGELGRHSITVVSGLAKGVDTMAHRGALEAGGRTIAVLGTGLDVVYPPENARLADEIAQRGALITDYPLGTQPEAGNFPPRNRLISGLSLGVVIVEAGDKSGALITCDYALEQGREVFAVPGNITSRMSVGTNRLIQQGAKLVTRVEDIVEELNLGMVAEQLVMRDVLPENDQEAALLRSLTTEPTHVDEIVRASGLPVSEVSATLTMMELKGMVRQVGGMNYVIAREPGPVYGAAA
ncbi:MAG: DNA-processing protein DprA [Chloroflexota bacterium]|nr:DNA-processing protein DprA [Chloroflexota bacterium]